ncbi:MAG TPA: hypothetical protein VII53_05725 [Solirubrobacteraceae bacterium]
MPAAARAAGVAAAVCLALTLGFAQAAPAGAETAFSETTATIKTAFSPDRLGAQAAFAFTVHFSGGEFGAPSPVRRAVLHLPPGLRMHIPSLRDCTRAHLQARGARGCPARSQIGSGHALADVHAGSELEPEEATVWAFLGPLQNGNPTIEILGQGYTPLDERVVVTGAVLPDRAPYGEELVMSIPPIPTIPLEPDASVVNFSLTIGGMRFKAHNPNTVVVPSHCPAGGFPFAADLTYADGTTGVATTTVPCP